MQIKKIRKESLLLSIIFSCTFLCSCINNSDHEKYIQEYVAIYKPTNELVPLIRHYKLIKDSIEDRQQKSGFKADLEYMDSLKNCDAKLQNTIANDIKIIEKIVELDNELKFRDKTLYLLNSSSLMYKKYTTKYEKICEYGANIAMSKSNKEEWDINAFKENAISVGEEVSKAQDGFQRKYNITNEELVQHGLSKF